MDSILRTGDFVLFDTLFGTATVVAPPVVITGSSQVKIRGAIACVLGDEGSVTTTASYHSVEFYNPLTGIGILTIERLANDQSAQSSTSNGPALLLVGTMFTAQLRVTVPASNPASSDTPGRIYMGTGRFSTSNAWCRTH
ncbi:hypothetical protein [Paraliomyxa miuraensis]|uniref:hypothetical protein n=1 Tax=Paraliomyxa miuraensis TaxID=376150 RepID=UPI002257A224|nr:hypothetical protein [Paraliomyxa miuraensis]MCX4245565.1 hypothetical protein [Paraliomyxa miuraensis]